MIDRRIFIALPCLIATACLSIYSFLYGQEPLYFAIYFVLLLGTVALMLSVSKNATKQEVIESYSKVNFDKVKL